MHTKLLGHAETRSISISTPPATVLDLLDDARRLPDWAPAFASAVEPDGEDWLVDSGGTKFRIRLESSPEHGIVDLTRPGDPGRGARMRVLPNEDGSEFVFTLIFPAGTPAEAIERQMATVESELRTVRELCEAEGAEV
jgi:polyketide cyclase/dehydrase/lipid transport protein